MSLKINVIYKGIIYRVKGMKVLCSVVVAVILLLVSIVGMGVWMLINVYNAQGTPKTVPGVAVSNISDVTSMSQTIESLKPAPSIEFGSSEDIPSNILRHDLKDNHDGKEVEPVRRNLSPSVASDAELYGAAFYDSERKDSYAKDNEFFSAQDRLGPSHSQPGVRDDFERTADRETAWRDEVEKVKNLPPNLIPKNINTAILSNDGADYSIFHDLDYPSSRPKESDTVPSSVANRQIPTKQKLPVVKSLIRKPDSSTTQFSRRNGIPLKNKLIYIGPPVVGYGSNPYEVMTQERIKEYDNFWRTYAGNKSLNKSRDNHNENVNKFTRDDAIRNNMKPHLRGLRPIEDNYDVFVRPDAQVPVRVRIPTSSTFQPPSSFPPRRRLPHPPPRHPPPPSSRAPPLLPTISNYPFKNNPDRKLFVGDQRLRPIPQTTTTVRPSLPLLSPLQNLYDYSKKLAASLLSFNSKSADQIKDSSQKLGEYGINLMESHNQVFGHPIGGPFERIVELIPSAERLRSFDPFELSLITWTFLDFWEFLIEKVGTLSNQDLSLLQQRLDKLRKRKNDAMTKVFVNETLTRYSSGKQRSISTNISHNDHALLENHKASKENVNRSNQSHTKDGPSITNTVHLQAPPSYGQMLSDLFPGVTSLRMEGTHPAAKPNSLANNSRVSEDEENRVVNETMKELLALLSSSKEDQVDTSEGITEQQNDTKLIVEGRSSAWDPLGLFTSEARMEFMQFAVKVLFNFGKVCLKKPYALDCSMLLFCKDLNRDTRKGGLEAMAAKLKSVGLKVLTESEQELRESDTFGQVWRSVTAWTPLECDAMFPKCDGPKALEIVNEVAMGNQ